MELAKKCVGDERHVAGGRRLLWNISPIYPKLGRVRYWFPLMFLLAGAWVRCTGGNGADCWSANRCSRLILWGDDETQAQWESVHPTVSQLTQRQGQGHRTNSSSSDSLTYICLCYSGKTQCIASMKKLSCIYLMGSENSHSWIPGFGHLNNVYTGYHVSIPSMSNVSVILLFLS